MNRKSPSEMAKIAYSTEAEDWIKTSISIKELDKFIHLIPAQMLINKVHTYQLAIDKRAQLQFESNQDASRRRDERIEAMSRKALRNSNWANILSAVAIITAIVAIIIACLIKN